MTTPAVPIRQRIFRAVARFDVTHPWLVLMLSAILAALCVMYTKARLQFQTGQDDLISANNRASRDYLNYTKEFPDLDGLIVAVRTAPDRVRAERLTDALAARLKADRVNVKSVFYRVDRGEMGSAALLYLSLDDLQELDARLTASIPMIQAYGADPTLATLFAIVNAQLDRAAAGLRRDAGANGAVAHRAGAQDVATNPAANLAMLNTVLAGMLADPASNPPSPWIALNPLSGAGGAARDGFLASDNGKYLLIDIAPGDGAANGPDPVAVIQADLDAVRAQMPGVAAGMTGGPALAYAEQSTTQHDMMLASVLAISSNIALIVIPFRGLVEPLFAIIALLTGVAWSFGFTTLAVGHLNLLSAVFTSVLAGIGINFPIHLMARYDEARRNGAAMPAAVDLAVVNTGTGVFASACIMALAFLMPMFTDFKGIAELGLVSAAGLFMCLLSAMLVFPALVALRDRRRPPPVRPMLSLAPRRSTLEKLFARPGLIVGLSVAATAGALFLIRDVHFDQNVLKLQASGAEAVRYENLLLRDSGRSSWFAVALAPTAAAADRKAAAFRKLPEVADVQTLTTYIPTRQPQKLALLAALGRRLAPVSIRATPSADDGALARELNGLAARLNAMRQADPSGGVLKTAALAEDAIARLKRQPG
ncbi:MAG TPA: MMPL family transporter, partial [Candidatus Binataceae bacterium]|nr:MMPL family transporter [Candidatus Binataceae bacterium]